MLLIFPYYLSDRRSLTILLTMVLLRVCLSWVVWSIFAAQQSSVYLHLCFPGSWMGSADLCFQISVQKGKKIECLKFIEVQKTMYTREINLSCVQELTLSYQLQDNPLYNTSTYIYILLRCWTKKIHNVLLNGNMLNVLFNYWSIFVLSHVLPFCFMYFFLWK